MSIVAFVYLLLILLTMCVDIGKAGPEVSASFKFSRLLISDLKMNHHFWDLRIILNIGFFIIMKYLVKLKVSSRRVGFCNYLSWGCCVLNLSLIVLGYLPLLFRLEIRDILLFCNNLGIIVLRVRPRACCNVKCLGGLDRSSITLWLSILNLILIVISNTSLLNPGPTKKFFVMYL